MEKPDGGLTEAILRDSDRPPVDLPAEAVSGCGGAGEEEKKETEKREGEEEGGCAGRFLSVAELSAASFFGPLFSPSLLVPLVRFVLSLFSTFAGLCMTRCGVCCPLGSGFLWRLGELTPGRSVDCAKGLMHTVGCSHLDEHRRERAEKVDDFPIGGFLVTSSPEAPAFIDAVFVGLEVWRLTAEHGLSSDVTVWP